jgi:hypothetical protein
MKIQSEIIKEFIKCQTNNYYMDANLENFYLANDKIVRAKDYTAAFGVCDKTARKMFNSDREELVVNFLMYSHFWLLYGRFPDESFLGVWREKAVNNGNKRNNAVKRGKRVSGRA